MTGPFTGAETFVGNQNGTTSIATFADVAVYMGQTAMPLIVGGAQDEIPIQTSTGFVFSSGKKFDDSIVTANNIWSALQTEAAITQQVLNVPTLPSVRLATTANSTRSGLTAIDGVTPVAGDLILVKNQTNGDNGVFKAAAGAWVRQEVIAGTFVDVTTETTYAELNINGGVLNVREGTLGRNLQFQFAIANPSAVFGASIVTVTATTKLPVASPTNMYVDAVAGNDTNFTGSSSYPYATLGKAFTAITNTPAVINLMSNSTFSSAITWTQVNTTVQGSNLTTNGGTQTITGQQSFASGSRYNHFTNTNHSTGATAPFSFASGALCSNIFKNITVNTVAADWLGLNAGCLNWVRLSNISFAVPGLNAINLPAFTNPFTVYIDNQDTFFGPIFFTGTGSANTTIFIAAGVAEGNVRIPSTFVGNVIWQQPFRSKLGAPLQQSGLITDQTQLTTIISHTATTNYDGFFAISGFNPTSFSRGAIIAKQTVAGVGTSVWLVRTYAQSPEWLQSSFSGDLYTQLIPASDWATPAFGNNVMTGATSGSNGVAGLVPQPLAGDEDKLLNGAGTWVVPPAESVMTGATSGSAGTQGLVPQPQAGDEAKVLSGAGTWVAQSGGSAGTLVSANGTSYLTQGSSATLTSPAPGVSILNVNIPSAGTWLITADLDFAGNYFNFCLRDGASEVANSRRYGVYSQQANPGTPFIEINISGSWIVTTTGAKTFTVNAFGSGSIRSDANNGYTKASYTQISGQTTAVLVPAKQYAKYTCPANTSQTLSANYPIKFTQVEATLGTDITINGAGDQITLQVGRTYRLRGSSGVVYGNGTTAVNSFFAQWYNGTAGNYVGATSALASTSSGNFDAFFGGTAEYTFTPAATTIMQLRTPFYSGAVGIGFDAANNIDQQPWFEIESLN
jgi:hypothetical protein